MKNRREGGEDDIIYIKEEISSVGAVTIDKERVITCGMSKTKSHNVVCKALVPCARCLFQAV